MINFNTTNFHPMDWLRAEIVHRFTTQYPESVPEYWKNKIFTSFELDALFSDLENDESEWAGDLNVVLDELRDSGEETGILREETLPDVRLIRDYDDTEVAVLCLEKQWVGFTYWSGGGRHGDPESIPWMEHAYLLNVTEREVIIEETVIKRTFSI